MARIIQENELEIYKKWAPEDALWTEWVKPVLFMNIPLYDNTPLDMPDVSWIAGFEKTAIIIDLPGKKGIEAGIAAAGYGYRPIPLYNGINDTGGPSMVVDSSTIAIALNIGSFRLEKLHLRPDAPPAFLLDSNRMKGKGRYEGRYDNRWCVFPQDMPSASYLKKKGIEKVLVRSDKITGDLSHILRRYQDKGISILWYKGYGDIVSRKIKKPKRYKSFLYRFGIMAGLIRNASGGFGGIVPENTGSGG